MAYEVVVFGISLNVNRAGNAQVLSNMVINDLLVSPGDDLLQIGRVAQGSNHLNILDHGVRKNVKMEGFKSLEKDRRFINVDGTHVS